MKSESQRLSRRERGMRAAIVTVAAFLLGLLVARATNTVSRPVGFIRVSLPPTNQALSAIPFKAFTNTIPGILRAQLTGGDTSTVSDNVLKWDPVSQSYLTFWKDLGGVWHQDVNLAETTNRLLPGDGFWVVNRHASTQAVYLAGHVVLDATNSLTFGALLNLFSYPFSTRIGVNAADFVNDGARGDSILANADQISEAPSNSLSWLYFNTNSALHDKWVIDTNNISPLVLMLGQGYWYDRNTTNSFSWSETRPYPNPFPANGGAPAITNITINGAGDQATLRINTLGTTGEEIDVYFQDVSATNAFHTTNGWAMATADLLVGGLTSINWTDDGSGGRGSVNTVAARFYLVGRGDIDSDADGLPDAREVYVYHTNPNGTDTDGDGMPDGWEVSYGLNPVTSDAAGDVNSDNLSNLAEYQNNTKPNDADTDDDGLPDGWEFAYGLNLRSDVLTNNLAAWWTFNEGAGNKASNNVGTNYVGSLQNMDNSNWTTGFLSGALKFDGTNEFIAVTQSTAIVTGGPFTVIGLAKLDGTFGENWPAIVGDSKLRTDDFPVAVATGVPPGWAGGVVTGNGATNGSGDGNAAWSVPSSGNHQKRAVFSGTGSGVSSPARSRNSFLTKSLVMAAATSNRPQEWAFNASYDASNTSDASDANRWRVWLWADGTNLDTANGYAVEYGKDTTTDRLELYRMTNGSKSGSAIIGSGTNVASGDVQYSVRIQRSVTGVWRMWNAFNTVSSNSFPAANPLSVTNDLQVGTNNAFLVEGKGHVGFQAFINTGSTTTRAMALDDLSVNGQITGFGLRYRNNLVGLVGNVTNTAGACASNAPRPYLDRWQSVALRFDGTNASLWMAGVTITNVPAGFAAALQSTLLIGRDHDEATNSYLKGKMDDLRIYRRALTAAEVVGLYEGQSDPDQDGVANIDEYVQGTNPTNGSSFLATLSGTVTYGGAQTGLVWVYIGTPGIGLPGQPPLIPPGHTVSLSAPGAYSISNLPTLVTHYVRAVRDSNGNGKIDICEAQGNYPANPIYLTNNLTGVNITMTHDTSAPSVTKPSNVTIQCDASINPLDTGTATASDDRDPSPAISYTDTVATAACADNTTIYRRWTATDACGNTSQGTTQVITRVDTTVPVLVMPSNVVLGCGQSSAPSHTGYATAIDNCDTTNAPPTGSALVWINEFHYDNTGTDADESVELAGLAGVSLSGYAICLYNGADGKCYDTNLVSGTIDDESCGYGALAFAYPVNGIQNGNPDGIALVQGTNVIQFLSYEGSFTAVGGPASGRTSTDIGVDEDPTPAVGQSLRLTGTGNKYVGFSWAAPATASAGSLNAMPLPTTLLQKMKPPVCFTMP